MLKIEHIKSIAKEHGSELLIGAGIGGIIGAGILGIAMTPKALQLLEEKRIEVKREELTPIEKITTAGPCYIIPVAMAGVSVACIISGHSNNLKRNAALATAYAISEGARKEYKDKVLETLGVKKENDICDEIEKDRLKKNPVSQCEVIETGHGNTLFFDSMAGRYFRSDMEFINKSMNEINHRLLIEGYISLNDIYDQLDLHTNDMGEILGWNINAGLIEHKFTSHLDSNGNPAAVFRFVNMPVLDFDMIL